MGNVIHRGKGSFTFVENTIFFDYGLSAKAKGIYCQIRSLENNPGWVFTIKGFASLVRDGADAVSAGIKELESSGYIIRARKRSENGRFLKAEEATWITLDDPAMHAQVAAELKADGYAILSEFTREPPANVEFEPSAVPLGATATTPRSPRTSLAGSKERAAARHTPTSPYRPTCWTLTESRWTWWGLRRPTPTSRSCGARWRRAAASSARSSPWEARCRRRSRCSRLARRTAPTSAISPPARSVMRAT